MQPDAGDERVAASGSRSLEELLEAGMVECALVLKDGPYTDRELELIRRAFGEGVRLGKLVPRVES